MRTPFAAVTWFEDSFERAIEGPSDIASLLADLDVVAADPDAACAVRIDGEFESVLARSMPRQLPPYRPLADVVADQHVFEFGPIEGTLVGFRFPDYDRASRSAATTCTSSRTDRSCGGHLLDCRLSGRAGADRPLG